MPGLVPEKCYKLLQMCRRGEKIKLPVGKSADDAETRLGFGGGRMTEVNRWLKDGNQIITILSFKPCHQLGF